MLKTPQALRLHLGIFGRTNVGKSSLLNLITGQPIAITSSRPGTTTDAVIKSMELLPLGPVLLLDTAGMDDTSLLAGKRVKATGKIFDRTDIAILVLESDIWTNYEQQVVELCSLEKIPCLAVINKIDLGGPSPEFLDLLKTKVRAVIKVACTKIEERDRFLEKFKTEILALAPDDFLSPPPLVGDLLESGTTCILIVPIDLEAPKGRIILPQVQAIRDLLDHDQAALIVKENGYRACLNNLKTPPGLVVCDSQVVDFMVRHTPASIPCTTFSILFSRWKGGFKECLAGVEKINTLKDNDAVLIAEACTHHPLADDIARVKLPLWLKKFTKKNLIIDIRAGRDYPENLQDYQLVIHCGACMLSRQEMLIRIRRALEAGTAVTNYGICISYLHGVLNRVVAPLVSGPDNQGVD